MDRLVGTRPVWTKTPLFRAVVLVLAGVALGLIVGFLFEAQLDDDPHVRYVLLALAFGATVGASELVARYRDEPLEAVTSLSGGFYVLLNGFVSALVYGLLAQYGDSILPGLTDKLMTALVAGFGAMAVLRLKFFNFRTNDGEDVAVGPDAIVTTLLDAADRGVDRSRARRRLQMVFEGSDGVEVPANANEFLSVSLAALQNVGEADLEKVTSRIREVYEIEGLDDRLKLQAICYGMLSVTGDAFFRRLLASLRDYEKKLQAAKEAQHGSDEATEA